MAKNIGDFGTAHEIEELTFTYFGQEIRTNPEASELTYLNFLSAAMDVDQEDQTKSIKLTMDFLKKQIHDDDWEAFWSLALSHRQKLDDLMKISRAIVEATSGFPTTPPSGSPSTRPNSGPKSPDGSSSRGRHREPEEETVTDKAMALLEGRPDLQQAVVLANLPDL